MRHHCSLTQHRGICLKSRTHERWRDRGGGTSSCKPIFFLSFGCFLAFLPHIYQSSPGASSHPHPQYVGNTLLCGPDPYECIFRKCFLFLSLTWMECFDGPGTWEAIRVSWGLQVFSSLTSFPACFLLDESTEHIQAHMEEEAFWGKGRQPANSSWRTVCGNYF